MEPSRPLVIVGGLGPADARFMTAETQALLDRSVPVWLRTVRHPAAIGLDVTGSFDDVYEDASDFDAVYHTIVERLVAEAELHGAVGYLVPGSPLVAERTVELLRADERIELELLPAVSFVDLCWAALGVDPLAATPTLVDAHRFREDAAGRVGPLLVMQVHSRAVLDDVIDAVDDVAPESVTFLQGLGTDHERVETVPWTELPHALDPDHLTTLWIPRLAEPVAASFVRFEELVRRLRAECPWDREQTHGTLRKHLVEEAYEVLDAIDLVEADPDEHYPELEEELGDLLFQVFFHSRLAAEQGRFTVADVADGIHDKLYRRHPHVFGDADPDATVADWERSKQHEKQRESAMDGIPSALPALLGALKVQKRAASTGFSGPDLAWALSDVADELAEVTAEPNDHEVGDLLFAAVQVARMLEVDPENALRAANTRFADRFRAVERFAADDGVDLARADFDVLQSLWQRAKG